VKPADTGIVAPDTGISVKILGAGIAEEGTYRMSSDSQIIDLVEKAGGLNKGALTSGIDWHQELHQGLTLTVPTREVFRKARSGEQPLTNRDLIRFRKYNANTDTQTQTGSELVNLNSAGRLKLQELPGIGDVLAGRIIDYREKNDGFEKVSEMREVFGIGDVTYQELRAKVTVD
jgi:competence protein ComEA